MNSFDYLQCEDVYPESDWDWDEIESGLFV